MANWCSNSLTVSGNPDSVKHFVQFAKKTYYEEDNVTIPFSFARFIPEPDYETTEVSPCIVDSPSGDSSNMPDWWNWRINHWGTKWELTKDTNVEVQENRVTYMFETAWEPPLPVIYEAAAIFPELVFEFDYYEPGMGFSGEIVIEHGKLTTNKRKLERITNEY